MNELFKLPDNWEVVTLEDVAEGKNAIVDGPFGSNLKTSDYIDDNINGVPVLTTKNLEGDYSDKKVRFISKAKFEELRRSQVNPGDILVAKIGSIGKTGIYPKNARIAIIPANLLKFTVSKKVVFNYVFYYLNSRGLQNRIKKISTATAQPAFNVTKFRKLLIPLPPKPAQQAIVSKIDELFSELDKGIEDLRTAQQQLKTYRQSVLKWAFEGKLTNENVKEDELPEGWKSVELGSVCSLITDGKHGDCKNEENSGYFFLSAKDVRNNTLLYENARQITKAGFEETHRRTNLKPGDICLVNTGATIGRISIAPNDEKTYRTTFQKSVAVIKCIPTLIDNKYCKYLLQGDLKKLVKVSSGTAVPNLLLGSLKKHNINLPPDINEQNKIIEEIESRLSVADKMEDSVTQSLQQAEALRQSILKKAFEGKLV